MPPSTSLSARRAEVVFMLPAYNESESLRPLLDAIHQAMTAARLPYSVVVVDDGSHDDTALIASQASFSMPVVLVEHETNQGLAAALRTGIRHAVSQSRAGDVIVIMDADNTQPPELVDRMVRLIREGHDVVIASRFRPGSRVVGVPWSRHALSMCARVLFQVLLPIKGVRDYTCGFRAYRAELLERALADYGDDFVSEKGFSCMVDVLLKLRKYRPIIGESPMILRYDQKGGQSKMRVMRTVWQTLSLIFRRRLQRT
jgi:dolichol-phosphate mannosyltransferase